MDTDYKDQIQRAADELAWDRYGMEFYLLSPFTRDSLYADATDMVNNRRASQADALLDAAGYEPQDERDRR